MLTFRHYNVKVNQLKRSKMKRLCKYCLRKLDAYEDKICDCCFQRMSEDLEEKFLNKTEEIFGNEMNYQIYKNGGYENDS